MSGTRMGVLAVLVVTACGDLPLADTGEAERGEEVAAAVVAAACTREWANGVDGPWNDGTMWVPAGVPGMGDVVCIEAPGTYTVTLDVTTSPEPEALYVGGPGSAVTLWQETQLGGHLNIDGDVHVRAGSELVMAGTTGAVQVGGDLTNDGAIRVTACSSTCATPLLVVLNGRHAADAGVLTNNGTIELSGETSFLFQSATATPVFRNRGVISAMAEGAGLVSTFAGEFRLEGGEITGAHELDLRPGLVAVGAVVWSGGRLGTLASDSTRPVVWVAGGQHGVTLATTTLTGSLGVSRNAWQVTGPSIIRGSIGRKVHLVLEAAGDAFTFRTLLSSRDPMTNSGTLEVVSIPLSGNSSATLTLPPFINTGSMVFGGSERIELETYLLINAGSVEAEVDVALSQARGVLRNYGTIAMSDAALVLPLSTTFESFAAGRMTGELQLEEAVLEGVGQVGDIVSAGGTIRPGWPVGPLTANTVTMDARTGLEIEIEGTTPGSHDQLEVTGQVLFGGTLTLTSLGSFAGGVCGQVVPIMTDGSTVSRGSFDKFVGLDQGPVRRWRAHDPDGAWTLVGYNPAANLIATPNALAVAEGGPGATYSMCLGPHAPSADVRVLAWSTDGEVRTTPEAHDITLTDWMLPRTITVTALDNGIVQALRDVDIMHTLTSADPIYGGLAAGIVRVEVTDAGGAASMRKASGR